MNLRLSFQVSTLMMAVLVSLLAPGCSQTVAPVAPSPQPSATTATEAPVAKVSPQEQLALVTRAYESGDQVESGVSVLKPLLEEVDPDSFDLTDPNSLERFDSELLPRLKEAFQKPSFANPHPLRSEPPAVNYRAIRGLVQLVLERATLYWEAGEKSRALELFELPLALSSSMSRRPQSVSSSLFSSTYSDSALRTLEGWLSQGLTAPELQQFQELLLRHRPDYGRVRETFTVDIAQLVNSLGEDPEALGLPPLTPETEKAWKNHLLGIYDHGSALYDLPSAPSPQEFNQAVLSSPPELQGLIIEYPEISSSQKHLHFRYLAAEVALALEAETQKAGQLPADLDGFLANALGQDSDLASPVLKIVSDESGKSFRIEARTDTFALLPGGQNMVLFQKF